MEFNKIEYPLFLEFMNSEEVTPAADTSTVSTRTEEVALNALHQPEKRSADQLGATVQLAKKVRVVFTEELDLAIVKAIEEKDTFQQIAERLGMKTQRIKNRWYNHLRIKYPDIKYYYRIEGLYEGEDRLTTDFIKSRQMGKAHNFTKEQDLVIVQGIEDKKNYKQIATDLKMEVWQIKNRWHHYLAEKYPHIKYNFKRVTFSKEDDLLIVEKIAAGRCYDEIADRLGMEADPLRKHWHKQLAPYHPDIKYSYVRVHFTKDQDQIIVKSRDEGKSYEEIAAELKVDPYSVEFRWTRVLYDIHRFSSIDIESLRAPVEDDPYIFMLPDFETETAADTTTKRKISEMEEPKQSAKRVVKFVFTEEHNRSIVQGIKDKKSYQQIAMDIGLTASQVRNRWSHTLAPLNPGVVYQFAKFHWTQEQDEILVRGLAENKTNREMALELGLTPEQVRHRREWLSKQKSKLN